MMSSWFSRTNISSLTGQLTDQLSTFTRDVLTEESEAEANVNHIAPELAASSQRIEQLEKTAAKLREETIRFKRTASEYEQKVKQVENEYDRLWSDHVTAIEAKDSVIKQLERQLLETKRLLDERDSVATTTTVNNNSRQHEINNESDYNDWSSFDWEHTATEESRTTISDFETPSLHVPSTQEEDRISKLTLELENERNSHKAELHAVEQFYEEKLSELESHVSHLKASQSSTNRKILTKDSSFQTQTEEYQQVTRCDACNQTEAEENTPIQQTTPTRFNQTTGSSFFSSGDVDISGGNLASVLDVEIDYNPLIYNSLEQYSSSESVRKALPGLIAALNELMLESEALKQDHRQIEERHLQQRSVHGGVDDGGAVGDGEGRGSNSSNSSHSASSTVDSSNGSGWHLVTSSSSNKQHTKSSSPPPTLPSDLSPTNENRDLGSPLLSNSLLQTHSPSHTYLPTNQLTPSTTAISPTYVQLNQSQLFDLANLDPLLSSLCKQDEVELNIEVLKRQCEELSTTNLLVLASKLAINKDLLETKNSQLSEENQSAVLKLQDLEQRLKEENSKIVQENKELAKRLKELSTALEMADHQLQKIDLGERSDSSQSDTTPKLFEIQTTGIAKNEECSDFINAYDDDGKLAATYDSYTEDLRQTRDLLDEALSSNQKMAAVMEDQKQNIEELQQSNETLQSEVISLRELTQELNDQIVLSEEMVEQLRKSHLETKPESTEECNSLSREPEFQLNLITNLQNEVLKLRHKVEKAQLSPVNLNEPRHSSSNRSTPVSFLGDNSDRSLLEKALLDKEEMIVRLNREIDHLKVSLAELSQESNNRFETHSELLNLKSELISLQKVLEKQEDLICDKDNELSSLQIQTSQQSERNCKTICELNNQIESLKVQLAQQFSKESSVTQEIEQLKVNYQNICDQHTTLNNSILQMIQSFFNDKLENESFLDCTQNVNIFECLRNHFDTLITQKNDFKQALEEESFLKEKSIEKIAELTESLRVSNDSLAHERKVVEELQVKCNDLVSKLEAASCNVENEKRLNEDLNKKCDELIVKLESASGATNEYGTRLREVSEKLASSVYEKCDLNARLGQLMSERLTLCAAIERLKNEKCELNKEIENLKQELKERKDVCEQLTVEIEQLINSGNSGMMAMSGNRETAILHDDAEVRSRDLSTQIEDLKSKISALEHELQSARSLNEDISSELSTKEAELAKINSEMKVLCAELELLFETCDGKEISKIISWMKDEMSRMEKDVLHKDSVIKMKNEAVEILEDKIEALKHELIAKALNTSKLSNEVEKTLREELSKTCVERDDLNKKCDEVIERNNNLTDTVAQLESYLQVSEKRLEEVLSGDWENRCEQERKIVSTQKGQLSELRILVESYEKQLDEALEDYETMKQKCNSLSQQLSGNSQSFQQEIGSLKRQINDLNQENIHLNQQIKDSQAQISNLSQQLRESFEKIKKFGEVVSEKDKLIASLNEQISSSDKEVIQNRAMVAEFEERIAKASSESERVLSSQTEFVEQVEKLRLENNQLRTRNEALTQILNENEQGWNEKFKKQQDDFETYAQQAYQVRSLYDQLLFAYNEKVQQNKDLELKVENLVDEVSKMEERMLDASSMAPMGGYSTNDKSESQIEPSRVDAVTSRCTPDLLQVTGSLGNKSQYWTPSSVPVSGESLEGCDGNLSEEKDGKIKQLNEEILKLKHELETKDEELTKLVKRGIEMDDSLNTKLKELSEVSSRNEKLSNELSRLREHMLAIEEGYTNEALSAEDREKQLRNKLYQAEEKLQKLTSSNSVIDSETLSRLTEQDRKISDYTFRINSLEAQLSDATDQMNLYKEASQNLQMVLENFQKEKGRELKELEESFEKRIKESKDVKTSLESKLQKLTNKLKQQEELLEQAAHLNSEVELREEEIEKLKLEVDLQVNNAAKWKMKAQEAIGVGERVEKQLVKNLLVAYLTVPSGRKGDALNMIARFLEFSPQERAKVGLDQQKGWFSGWMPAGGVKTSQEHSAQESFSKKFIEFLEAESSQPSVVSLPHHHLNPPLDSSDPSPSSQQQWSANTTQSSTSPPSSNKLKVSSTGSTGFNPFSPSVLPQLSPHSTTSSRDSWYEQSHSQRSRQSSVSNSSTTTGAAGLDDSEYQSDVSSTSVTTPAAAVPPSHKSSFLKDLLKEH